LRGSDRNRVDFFVTQQNPGWIPARWIVIADVPTKRAGAALAKKINGLLNSRRARAAKGARSHAKATTAA